MTLCCKQTHLHRHTLDHKFTAHLEMASQNTDCAIPLVKRRMNVCAIVMMLSLLSVARSATQSSVASSCMMSSPNCSLLRHHGASAAAFANHVTSAGRTNRQSIPTRQLTTRKYSYNPTDTEDAESLLSDLNLSGYQRPKVNWYPGHIAKAERQLSETLKSVDVVIEVRDSRAPKATAHPSVGKWTAGRPRVVVLTRMDTVTSRSRDSWREAYERLGADRWEDSLGGEEINRNAQMRRERSKYDTDGNTEAEPEAGVEEILFVDAKRGQGTHAISRAVYKAGRHVNERRKRRGLNDRPLRVGIIGFPNVGKVRAVCGCLLLSVHLLISNVIPSYYPP